MKSSGYVRKIDPMGRVVIPASCREMLSIQREDNVEIFLDGANMIIRKYQPTCIFCDSAENTFSYKGKLICENCAAKLRSFEPGEALK